MGKRDIRSQRGSFGSKKGERWRSAWERIDAAISEGYFLEAIALEDSLITDRLESLMNTQRDAVAMQAIGEAIKWAVANSSNEFGSLRGELFHWLDDRNRYLHQMAKHAADWQVTWDVRLPGARDVALRGGDLVRAVNKAMIQAADHHSGQEGVATS